MFACGDRSSSLVKVKADYLRCPGDFMFLLPHVSFASEKCIQALSQGEHLIFSCMLLHEDAVHMITFNSTLQPGVLQKQGTREKPVKVGTIKPHQAKQDKS